jgi:hypothetical protein
MAIIPYFTNPTGNGWGGITHGLQRESVAYYSYVRSQLHPIVPLYKIFEINGPSVKDH